MFVDWNCNYITNEQICLMTFPVAEDGIAYSASLCDIHFFFFLLLCNCYRSPRVCNQYVEHELESLIMNEAKLRSLIQLLGMQP